MGPDPVQSVIERLPSARRSGDGWSAKCPAHTDTNASLSVGRGDDGSALVCCHKGCKTADVMKALGLAEKDLYPTDDSNPFTGRAYTHNGNGKHEKTTSNGKTYATADDAVKGFGRGPADATWTYHDATGEVVGLVLRWDRDGKKEIRPVSRHPDGWRIAAMIELRPLYRLAELAHAAIVLVTEGEKAADAAATLGFTVTTSSGGSSASHKTDWSPLAGKVVWILPDNDAAGRKYADGVARILTNLVPPSVVKIVALPGVPEAGDIVEWIGAHGDAAEPDGMRAEIEALGKQSPDKDELSIVTIGELVQAHPDLRPSLIDGLLRQGETMNIIAASKTGKSWLSYGLAFSVATGSPWLGTFPARKGRVLIIDNELHPETSAHRLPKVAQAMGFSWSEVKDSVSIINLRGRLKDLLSIGDGLLKIPPGRYDFVILDAMFRAQPKGTDENDNGAMAALYNAIDHYADHLKSGFGIIHHASKGNQAAKAVTDVGSGAGAQSRATDTHLVLRPHEEENVVVLDAAVRSWAPVSPLCLRWDFPIWAPAPDLDPTCLRSPKPRRGKAKDGDDKDGKKVPWTAQRFAKTFASEEPKSRAEIEEAATILGLSERHTAKLLNNAIELKFLHWRGQKISTQAPNGKRVKVKN